MHLIGTIIRVQIQRSPLKTGSGADRHYSPAPLLVVEKLLLSPEGVQGITPDGVRLLDVHHLRHPQTRNRDNLNGLSFNFVAHYAALQARFGAHLVPGCAGENILLETAGPPDVPAGALAIQRAEDGSLIDLVQVQPAPPCEPFSRFCAGGPLPAAAMKAALQFLDDGQRGYYATLGAAQGLYTVQPGDRLVQR
ncbi:MAG: hypothetical protein MUE40_15850 [Anaerolineae bacterium]|nr:hypothetical protein [Anaerolineae bacterium]